MRNFIKAIEAELERLTNLAMQNNQEKPTFKKEDLMRQLEHCIETGQIKLEYNEESESIIGNIEQWVQDLTDSMAINCRNKIAEKEMMSIFRGYAKKNRISPMKDRVLSEVWDGESRLIKSFPFKYEDTQYNRDIIRNFWINLVARVLNPGCNISQSMVLKGNQGIGKSRFCELVGGDFYVNMDSLNEWNDQNDCMKIRGKMICEFGEMQTTKKNSVDKIKNWLTKSFDEYREPYGRETRSVQRTINYIFTSNKNEILNDPTGSRRFMILDCLNKENEVSEDSFQWLKENIGQIFAEAVNIYKENNERVFQTDLEKSMKEIFRAKGQYEEIIEEALSLLPTKPSTTQIIEQCRHLIGVSIRPQEIGSTMPLLNHFQTRENGKRVWVKKF